MARATPERRETASHDDVPIGERAYRSHDRIGSAAGAGVEARVERASGCEAADVETRIAAEPHERPANQDRPILLHRQRVDGPVRTWIEAFIDLAVSIEPADSVSGPLRL